ncbi:MAG: ABC transporter permease [Ilumatobacteraceae bacterium]
MPAQAVEPRTRRDRDFLSKRSLLWIGILAGILVVSAARVISDNDDLTSAGTFGVMVRTAAPIALAGLAGLFAERSGTVNIGLEGMMIMGTIFAGWWGWQWGPWMAIVGGVVGGILPGLLHALATATFGVNHIVSGFAINIIAPGVARFMAGLLFVNAAGAGIDGGSISNSPGLRTPIGRFTLPLLSGGDLFGWRSPDPLGWLADRGWFVVSDVAGLLKGLTSGLTLDIILVAAVFVASVYVLWKMPFGLRLRSAGERPSAADSLGVPVLRYRYYGMIISGGLAGLGGAVMVLFANRYQENQVGGRGFLGLATLVVGNWRPAGVAAGAALFGYFQGITLRTNPEQLVLALLLVGSLALAVAAAFSAVRQQWAPLLMAGVVSLACGFLYVVSDRPNNQFVYITPYLVTLIMVSVRGQALRPPAQAGIPWRKGMQI